MSRLTGDTFSKCMTLLEERAGQKLDGSVKRIMFALAQARGLTDAELLAATMVWIGKSPFLPTVEDLIDAVPGGHERLEEREAVFARAGKLIAGYAPPHVTRKHREAQLYAELGGAVAKAYRASGGYHRWREGADYAPERDTKLRAAFMAELRAAERELAAVTALGSKAMAPLVGAATQAQLAQAARPQLTAGAAGEPQEG